MSGVGSLGDTSVFGVFFIDGLSSEDVVEQLGQQEDHGDDGQNERHVIQRLIAKSILGSIGAGGADGTAGSVVNIIQLVDSSRNAQTNDEDQNNVENEGVLSLGGQEEFQGDPDDHQTGTGEEKTTGGTAPAASDDSLQARGVSVIGSSGKGFGGTNAGNIGDFLTGDVARTLIRTPG